MLHDGLKAEVSAALARRFVLACAVARRAIAAKDPQAQLRADIEAFLDFTGMGPATFGWLQGRGSLVAEMRAGRRVSDRVAKRLRAFMERALREPDVSWKAAAGKAKRTWHRGGNAWYMERLPRALARRVRDGAQ